MSDIKTFGVLTREYPQIYHDKKLKLTVKGQLENTVCCVIQNHRLVTVAFRAGMGG